MKLKDKLKKPRKKKCICEKYRFENLTGEIVDTTFLNLKCPIHGEPSKQEIIEEISKALDEIPLNIVVCKIHECIVEQCKMFHPKPKESPEWELVLSDVLDSLRCLSCHKYFPDECEDCPFADTYQSTIVFINNLLSKQRVEMRERIKNMKIKIKSIQEHEKIIAYNDAIDDLLKDLKE